MSVLSAIKAFVLPAGEMPWAEFGKTLLYLKTGYVINQYWFLQALVMLYLFFPLFKRTFDSDKASLSLFAAAVFLLTFGNKLLYVAHQMLLLGRGRGLCEVVKNYIPWYNCLYRMYHAYAFVYFLAGGLVYHYVRSVRPAVLASPRLRRAACVTFAASWGLSVLTGCLFVPALKWDPCFGGYDLVTTFLMTCCFCLVMMGLRMPRLPRPVELVSRNTLGIYLVHGILVYATRPWIAAVPLFRNALCYASYVAFVLSVSLLVVWQARRVPLARRLFRL